MVERNSLLTGKDVRNAARSGALKEQTSGLAPGYVQANLIALPADVAADFLAFCQANPKACPLLAVTTAPGNPILQIPGQAPIDLSKDIPAYRVLGEDGQWKEDVEHDVSKMWQEEKLVGFAIGCSFSFEAAMQEAGIPMRHIDAGLNVPMFDTNLPCEPRGIFEGNKVVTLRAIPADKVAEAKEITDKFTRTHGGPIHIGAHDEIGIKDINTPEYGDKPIIFEGDELVFWECGVTPQKIVENASKSQSKAFPAIAHAPGHMLVLDVKDENELLEIGNKIKFGHSGRLSEGPKNSCHSI